MAITMTDAPEDTSALLYDHTDGTFSMEVIPGIDHDEEEIVTSWFLPNGNLVVITKDASGGGIGVG